MQQEEMYNRLRAKCEQLCASIQNEGPAIAIRTGFLQEKCELDILCMEIYAGLKVMPEQLPRRYTTRDESSGHVSAEDPGLDLHGVLNITDFSNLEVDQIAVMDVGVKLNFRGVTVERTQ